MALFDSYSSICCMALVTSPNLAHACVWGDLPITVPPYAAVDRVRSLSCFCRCLQDAVIGDDHIQLSKLMGH